jgi:hypothetical protein
MAKKKINQDLMKMIRNRLCDICLEDNVDARTYNYLFKHKLVKGKGKIEDVKIVVKAFQETASICSTAGPYIFTKEDTKKGSREAINISVLLLSHKKKIRELALNYLLQSTVAPLMCLSTQEIIIKNKPAILSESREKWVSAAIKVSDSIENDWLFNCQGALQSLKTNFKQGINECLTKLLRPDISSFVALNRGILTPNQSQDEIKKGIKEIVEKTSTFPEALEKYYTIFGYIPLADDFSVCDLYNNWVQNKGRIENIWRLLWEWANSNPSPIRRYHVCNLFITHPSLIPDDEKDKFLSEVLSIICFSEQENKTWHNQWVIRCELARYYCEYLESKLPGANGDKIASQSWWLAEKVSSIFQKEDEIIEFRKTIEPEENQMSVVWQLIRLGVEPSVFRYATLYVRNLWSISLIAQLGEEVLNILLSSATDSQKESLASTITGNMTILFPTKESNDKPVFGFDCGCIGTARKLINIGYQGKQKELLNALIESIEKLTNESQIETYLKRLPEGNQGDQILTVRAIHILAGMNKIPEQIIFNYLIEREWVKRVFSQLNDLYAENLFDGLHEIQIRNKGKWDEQLPHVYAFLCEELHEDKEKLKLYFAFTVISSLAADSISAIDRLLKGRNRFDYQDEVKQWRNKIEHSMPYISELCRARLRGMLANLYI